MWCFQWDTNVPAPLFLALWYTLKLGLKAAHIIFHMHKKGFLLYRHFTWSTPSTVTESSETLSQSNSAFNTRGNGATWHGHLTQQLVIKTIRYGWGNLGCPPLLLSLPSERLDSRLHHSLVPLFLFWLIEMSHNITDKNNKYNTAGGTFWAKTDTTTVLSWQIILFIRPNNCKNIITHFVMTTR